MSTLVERPGLILIGDGLGLTLWPDLFFSGQLDWARPGSEHPDNAMV